MKRSFRFAPLPLVLLLGAVAHAESPPNFDANMRAPAAAAAAARNAGALRSPGGFVASVDPKRGVPTFFWADPSSASPPAALAKAGPEAIARAFLARNAELYGLSQAALKTAFVREVHDTGRGGIIVIFGQRVSGVDVFQSEVKVLLDRSGALVAIGGNLHGAATPKIKKPQQAFPLGAAKAIAVAAADAFGAELAGSDLSARKEEKAGYRYYDLKAAAAKANKLSFATPPRAKKVFYPMPERVVPAYYLEVNAAKEKERTSDLWGYVIAADSGEILVRRHLVHDATFKYKVWADSTAPFTPASGPQADYAPHPTGQPDNSVPPFVDPTIISMEGFNTSPNGTPDPWLDAAATVSTGNNIDAYADISGGDGFDAQDVRATPNGPLTFDRKFDTSAAPGASVDQRMASVTQLFYTTNWLHDYWYDSGFDEAAGNAQQLNFGRGGAEKDVLLAEAQDSSDKNNANMATPADGDSPRMQMFLFDGVSSSTLNIQPINLSPAHQLAQFGPAAFNVTATLVLASDGQGMNPNDACSAIVNNVSGKIALIDRGGPNGCTFEGKVKRAQQAGALGALIANNTNMGLPPMGEDPATTGVTIGSLGISQADGTTLKNQLAGGATLTVTMSANGGPDRDGSIDNDIVLHEWGHYFHQRLVACGSEQCGGESEGWGDFNTMFHKVREGDNVTTGVYATGVYVTEIFGDAGYFGIRRFPYSRDKAKNGLTFKHVENGVPLPAGPQQPAAPDNWEVHNSGEVWTTMLFQAYTTMILNGGHTFADNKRRMADYVIAGMKLAPPNPTFTEQRDGILAAAAAADPADFQLLAQGFAERGAGTCAISPPSDSSDGSGVVEDFNISGQQELVSATLDDSVAPCDGDGVLDAGEIGKLHITVRNTGAATLTGTKASVTSPTGGISFPNGNSVAFPDIKAFQTATADINVEIDGTVSMKTLASFDISVDNAAACKKSVSDTVKIDVHLDDVPNDSTTETVDSTSAPWAKWGAPGYESLAAEIWGRDQQANGNYRFYGQNFPSHSDTALVSPDLVVGAGTFAVTFAHRHDFESSPQNPGSPDTRWDGGLIEISSDGGASWQDVSMFASPGYNGTIADVDGADNPLANRPAFVARNAAWPNTNNVTLNFGSAFSGKTVKLRFRIGTDAAAGVPDYLGWYFDNIAVEGITNKPFRTVKSNSVTCANLSPIADAGPDQIVFEGDFVALDASGSKDPEADPMKFSWLQQVGPGVMLSNADTPKATFTAPEVKADTTLTFEVTVSDGMHSGKDTVNVLVKDLTGTGGSAGSIGGNAGVGGVGGDNGGTAGIGGNVSDGGSVADGGTAGNGGDAGNGGSGSGGDDLIVTACTCEVPGGDSRETSALLAPLLGIAALMMRRRRSTGR